MDRPALAAFLRRRREAIRPADVGLPPGVRRRTPGLRREEVAGLAVMSVDYYNRLERGQSPQPSPSMLTALARALRLTRDERDYLFRVAGHPAPADHTRLAHVRPGLLHLLDRLTDTPALITTDLGEILAQNDLAIAVLGDLARGGGPEASWVYRWFTEPSVRGVFVADDHDTIGAALVADLRAVHAARGGDPVATAVVERLRARSADFARLWDRHDVRVKQLRHKRVAHPAVGVLDLDVELLDSDGRRLLLLTAAPGSETARKLDLLRVIGHQDLTVG
ncbi:helix-turn-helix transcriptional regulator [Catenuloplanes atrovinosus]|nr:helix-turn-helix transcriptional regulator [Catenuloplanes atrovinosus]